METVRPRENQEEVEERGGEQEERDRAGVLDEQVDPPIGRRTKAADEKEQEENADDEKDPDRLVFGAFPEDEEADREEEEPDDRLVEVRRIAEGAPGEGDARRELVVAALNEIVEGGADPASEQLPGGIGGLAHDAVIDSFDLVS